MTNSYQSNLDYVRRQCIAAPDLAGASGLADEEIERLRSLGVLPNATYRVGSNWVASAIGSFGSQSSEPLELYYGPSVPAWLGRAALLLRRGENDIREALLVWIAADLCRSLEAAGHEAAQLGWAHVMKGGRPDPRLARAEVETYWTGWMRGGWAVCLRQFDGYHLMTKELERRRLSELTQDWTAPGLSVEAAFQAFGAMQRLAGVLMPFAPCERPTGTPGLFIDRTAAMYDIPWENARSRDSKYQAQIAAKSEAGRSVRTEPVGLSICNSNS